MAPLTVYRTAAGLSQRRLAEIAGVHVDTISLAERRCQVPRRATAQVIAAALGVQPRDIFPDNDSRPAGERAAVTTDGRDGPHVSSSE